MYYFYKDEKGGYYKLKRPSDREDLIAITELEFNQFMEEHY